MQMALTCSHKILKAHSNEAPGHNAAEAERSVEAGLPPVWEAERGREREREPFGHCGVHSGCLVESNHPLWLLLLHEHRHAQDKVTLHLSCNSAPSKSQTLLHCPELYPIITFYVMICNWMLVDLNSFSYQAWHQSRLICRHSLISIGFCFTHTVSLPQISYSTF